MAPPGGHLGSSAVRSNPWLLSLSAGGAVCVKEDEKAAGAL